MTVRWYCDNVSDLFMQLTAGRAYTHMFDELAHAGLRDTAPAKYLYCVRGGVLCAARHVRLEERDLPRKLARLLLVRLCTFQEGEMRGPAERSRREDAPCCTSGT